MAAPNGVAEDAGSILDTDLYKLTMQQAVLEHFPTSQVHYKFNNRSKGQVFSRQSLEVFERAVSHFSERKLTSTERAWLKHTCPYFKDAYLDYLESFRFRPSEQVTVTFLPESDADPDHGQIEIDVHGLWVETILYEVPLMAALSEAYFRTVDIDWSLDGQEEQAYRKGKEYLKHGVMLSEFGTRRRRSLRTHELVVKGLIRAHKEVRNNHEYKGELKGTSNVHFAQVYDLVPIGTIAHEWTMGTAALRGYATANKTALALWEETYPTHPSNALHIALTDTFTSAHFFREFLAEPALARRWRGLRQDSGDPIAFAKEAKRVYGLLGIDVTEKLIVFSDGLDLERCLELKSANDELGFQASFGVGTSLTNDFKNLTTGGKSKALNIVIKLTEIDGKQCVKLSDDLGKNTGNPETVSAVKKELNVV